MRSLQPILSKPDQKLARQLLELAAARTSIGQRMKVISEKLLGLPYIVNPLIGSPAEEEEFVVTLAGFDCVTFMETALALALTEDVQDFPEQLREIRYVYGEIAWAKRHHYTVNWARHNIRRGFLRDLTKGEETVNRRKVLDLVKSLPQRIVSFNYFPKAKLSRLTPLCEDGDLIFFVSTRKGLDVFHTGLLFLADGKIILRHAARSRGAVVDQELKEFVRANQMSGFILMRPQELSKRSVNPDRRRDDLKESSDAGDGQEITLRPEETALSS